MAATIVQSAICRIRTGRCRPHPTLFYFPGLSSQPWHDPRQWEWCHTLESNLAVIKEEYHRLVHEKGAPSDYDSKDSEHKLHEGEWDWHSYVMKGRKRERFREDCPRTAAILDGMGGDHMTGTPFSFSFFSTLHPGAAIRAHTAPCNLRLRCHFPVKVPSADPEVCGIRVGDEARAWEEGKCMLFDDCYEHEVWNRSEGDRVLLLFDLWHPELDPQEREAVQDMFGYAEQRGWLKGD